MRFRSVMEVQLREIRIRISNLYHATSARNLPNIQRIGLTPNRETSIHSPGIGKGFEKRWIYLAASIQHARAYLRSTGPDDPWIILDIDVSQLDPSKLGPDDDDLQDVLEQKGSHKTWDEFTWQQSLRMVEQCTYRGIIPPNAIRVIPG